MRGFFFLTARISLHCIFIVLCFGASSHLYVFNLYFGCYQPKQVIIYKHCVFLGWMLNATKSALICVTKLAMSHKLITKWIC